MSEKKPKVVAFYREHPTVMALAESIDSAHKKKIEDSKFHQKALERIRQEADKEGAELWAKLNAEMVRLGLVEQQEVDNSHFHLDVDTMTIQRCSGHHMLASLLQGIEL